jgi:glycine cleavage system H protein
MYQDDLKYTKTHEWVKLYKNRIARVGITDHAQQRFGNIQFVDLPEVGSDHDQFDSFVLIDGEKMLSEIDLPLGGRIIDVNEELDEDPSIINHDPYGDGWIVEIEISQESEIESLMDYEDYKKYLDKECKED